ncbi:pentatricopeptide repeat-containing protein At4g19220, mitochondrial [Cynara cardunculus var. scolymus]|uniref:Pentatricopeptide repeat-containing protein n=1 Tax=Cynara cardunculus var. scolymus TaxID=59895 RepID=A0A118JUV7_CYNCS|nr:pentatricopeptide repeat-containing protein At4g19220, mitochondrial [Cynara cardunculus var. scolymus]KVH91585.1 Pentatricopeptide repeat-containing protein [Cynara cardunculus var. scolymus]
MIRWACKFVALKTTLSSFPLKITPFFICNNHLLFDLPRFCHGSCHPFDEMPQRTPGHSSVGFFDVLDLVEICKVTPNVRNVGNVHVLAVKVGVLAHLPTSTSLVMAYARAGHYRSSVAVFNEISFKDVIIWNAMMTGSIENGRFRDAASVFVQMLREGIKFDSVTLVIAISALSRITYRLAYLQAVHSFGLKEGLLLDCDLYNALINAYARRGDLGSSERVFLETDVKDRISWNSMISGCLSNDHPEKSLWYFKKMVSCGKQVDNVGLSCAIASSTCLLDSHIGNIVHGLGIKLGYDESPHVSVLNALVSFYSKCGDINAAYTVFRGIYAKDLVSWNTMINGFASNGMILEAFHLLREMQFRGSVEPDTVTILAVLSLCAESMLLRKGKAIHGFVTRRLRGSDLLLINCLMNMYSKCTKMAEAESLFVSIRDKDLVSWNTMISGYAQNGESRFAQFLFKKLLYQSLDCTLSTVLAVLCSCNSPNFLRFGKSLHSWQLKLGFSNNILAVNSLLCMYTNCGDLKASYMLLLSVSTVADTACWNAMIAGCTQNGYFIEALETFKLMRGEEHAKHDSVTLVSVISACGNLELVFHGKLAHGFALKTSVDGDVRVRNALITMYGRLGDVDSAMIMFELCCNRNLCSWNCIISALSQNKEAKTAIHLFQNLDFEPDEITNATILSACTQLGTIRYGKQIHGHILRSDFHRNCFIVSALVDMYSNCGRLDMSIRIFHTSPQKTVASWNSMISAYGFHSEGQKAIEMFEEMIKSGEIPTKTTFINLLSACAHSGLVDEGLTYYARMFDGFGIEPVTEHHVCVVDMLGKCGRLTEAYEFIERMPVRPDQGVWGAMLSSCNYQGDLEMGKKVADILFGLEPKNAGYYVSLANAYVAAGSWSDAVKLRTFVQDVRLKKPAGYSLVDVGS